MRQIIRILKHLFLNIVALALLINGYEPVHESGGAPGSAGPGC